MSWSVSAVGKPAAVKASLATQFENAKKNTAWCKPESESVGHIESAVNVLLDSMLQTQAVSVSANGSCHNDNGILRSADTSITFKTLYGFVE